MKELFTSEEKGEQEKQFIQVPFELKELEDEGDNQIVQFKGYASTFNNMDLGRDIVVPGAFKDTIKKDGVTWPILHMHNSFTQLGWNAEGDEDKKGLFVLGELNLEVQLAREQYALAKHAKERGGKMGLSIGYRPEVWEIDQEKRKRYLKSLKMYEYSFVVWPMNPKARVSQIKSMFEQGFLEEEGEGVSDIKEICGSARMLEKVLREVGFSNSKAKALANAGVRMNDGESLREAGVTLSSPQLQKACDGMEALLKEMRA